MGEPVKISSVTLMSTNDDTASVSAKSPFQGLFLCCDGNLAIRLTHTIAKALTSVVISRLTYDW